MFLIRRLFYCLVLAFSIISCGQNDQLSQSQFWNSDKPYKVYQNFSVESFDGVRLKANLFVPNPGEFPGQRPAVIFANSWTLNHYEYTVQAIRLASRGYMVLCYATRGFGGSEGYASAASPEDVKDVSVLIDWLSQHHPVDLDNIAMSGVSYGGGISLLALANDERIKTVAALSSWSDLEEALYGNETVKRVWIELLIGSGKITGRLDPDFIQLYKDVRNQNRIDEMRNWAAKRGASTYLQRINSRAAPVFISNNYDDQLFSPNQSFRFFENLLGPKKLFINNGIHATAEISGLLGLPSRLWDDVHRWFDHWLLADDNGVMDEPSLALQFGRDLELFEGSLKKPDSKQLPLTTLNQRRQETSNSGESLEFVSVASGRDSGASTGIPIISSVLEAHTPIKVRKKIWKISKTFAAVYKTDRSERDLAIRGIPELQFSIRPYSANTQMIAYLYELDFWGTATLLSHGAKTLRNLEPGKVYDVSMEFAAIAHNLDRGRRLIVVVDTQDLLYDRLNSGDGGFDLLDGDLYRPILQVNEMLAKAKRSAN